MSVPRPTEGTSRGTLMNRADALRADRTPFVLATVVRAERPTSAKPGDRALVLPDGTVDGFVGGSCAESTVRLEGLRLLRAGESELLQITPDADTATPGARDGLHVVNNPCLSGGTLEIFLESMVPASLVYVLGDGPVARALVRVGDALEYDVRPAPDPAASGAALPADTAAVVVASHGRDEVDVIVAALRAEVPYIGLVASRRRAQGVRADLSSYGFPADRLARICSPAGLDIGSRSPAEIALSVYAEMVTRRAARSALPAPVAPGVAPASATDPVCGMSVATVASSPSTRHGERTVWFCGTGCREAFLDAPGRFGG